jgi:hypothetical protein
MLLTVPLEGVDIPTAHRWAFAFEQQHDDVRMHSIQVSQRLTVVDSISDENLSGDCCWTLARGMLIYADLRALLQQTRDDERPISNNIFSFIFLPILCCQPTRLGGKSQNPKKKYYNLAPSQHTGAGGSI